MNPDTIKDKLISEGNGRFSYSFILPPYTDYPLQPLTHSHKKQILGEFFASLPHGRIWAVRFDERIEDDPLDYYPHDFHPYHPKRLTFTFSVSEAHSEYVVYPVTRYEEIPASTTLLGRVRRAVQYVLHAKA